MPQTIWILGDPEAGPWFCIGWYPYLRELDAVIVAAGGKSLFGNDDGYLMGPGSVVLTALEKFAQQILENCLLRLEVSKTKVFSWEESLLEQAPPEMKITSCLKKLCLKNILHLIHFHCRNEESGRSGGRRVGERLHVLWDSSGKRKLCKEQTYG